MAVTFTPDSTDASEKTFVIGGQTTVTSSAEGVPGPFPKYGISREPTRGGNVPLNTKYIINFSAVGLFDGEMLDSGSRQNKAHKVIDDVLQYLKDKTGVLEIAPYGGQANILKFPDARLASVALSEQDEESAGVQFQNYDLTFEAYRKQTPTDSLEDSDNANKLQGVVSIEESWDISVLEEYSEFKESSGEYGSATAPFKVWQITHNISAVGVSTGTDYDNFAGSITDENNTTLKNNKKAMGYLNAKAWVESRLVDQPLKTATTTKDLQDFNMDLVVPLTTDATNPYKTYNHVRTTNQDTIGGSYSVTETWTASRSPATHTIEYSFDRPEDAEYDTVTVNVNVQGLASDATTYDTTTYDRYANALLNFDVVKTSVQAGASSFYTTVGGAGTLKAQPVAESRSDNETIGTIAYTATFNDKPQDDENADDESLTVTFNNTDHETEQLEDGTQNIKTQGNQVVAIIPILAKADGPVIQDMQTTNVKTISVSYSKTMTKAWRDENKPTENIGNVPSADAIVNQYKPVGGFRQNRVESWNPYNGQYNLDVDWVFNDNFSYESGGGGGGGDDGGGGDVDSVTGITLRVCGLDTILTVRNPLSYVISVGNILKVFSENGEELCGTVTAIDVELAENEFSGSRIIGGTYENCADCIFDLLDIDNPLLSG